MISKLLKNYANSVAGAIVTDEEALEFLKGLESYEVSNSLSNQRGRETAPEPYHGEKAGLLDSSRSDGVFSSVASSGTVGR